MSTIYKNKLVILQNPVISIQMHRVILLRTICTSLKSYKLTHPTCQILLPSKSLIYGYKICCIIHKTVKLIYAEKIPNSHSVKYTKHVQLLT